MLHYLFFFRFFSKSKDDSTAYENILGSLETSKLVSNECTDNINPHVCCDRVLTPMSPS